MLAGHIKDLVRLETLERFRKGVELLRFGQVRQVSGVQDKRRRLRQRIDLGNGLAQRGSHIRVGIFVETDMTVADLYEAEVALDIADLLVHDVAQSK